jgi:hypothetical protein
MIQVRCGECRLGEPLPNSCKTDPCLPPIGPGGNQRKCVDRGRVAEREPEIADRNSDRKVGWREPLRIFERGKRRVAIILVKCLQRARQGIADGRVAFALTPQNMRGVDDWPA